MGNALLDARECTSFEEIGQVDDVPGRAQVAGKSVHAGCQPLGMVEYEDLGHRQLLLQTSVRASIVFRSAEFKRRGCL
ncbi:hypothetical protein ACU4I5_12975 [Ensifer adhaerens]